MLYLNRSSLQSVPKPVTFQTCRVLKFYRGITTSCWWKTIAWWYGWGGSPFHWSQSMVYVDLKHCFLTSSCWSVTWSPAGLQIQMCIATAMTSTTMHCKLCIVNYALIGKVLILRSTLISTAAASLYMHGECVCFLLKKRRHGSKRWRSLPGVPDENRFGLKQKCVTLIEHWLTLCFFTLWTPWKPLRGLYKLGPCKAPFALMRNPL